MKKIVFYSMIFLLAGVSACNKTEAPAVREAGVAMTLKATIGDPASRVTFTDDESNKVLKAEWAAGDQVSVLSVNASGKLIANDIFTAGAAGKTATFTGTYTGGDAEHIMIYYPAYTQHNADDTWMVPVENGYSDEGPYYEIKVGSEYNNHRNSYVLQTALDSPSHLKYYVQYVGEADVTDMKSNTMNAVLHCASTVLKLKLTMPSAGKVLLNASVNAMKSGGAYKSVFGNGWGYIYSGANSGFSVNTTDEVNVFAGAAVNSGTASGLTLAGNTVTLYVPVHSPYGAISFSAGDYLVVDATYDSAFPKSDNLVFASDFTFELGKVYTISATLN